MDSVWPEHTSELRDLRLIAQVALRSGRIGRQTGPVWDQEAASSNLARPTITFSASVDFEFVSSVWKALGAGLERLWKRLEHAELRDLRLGT